MSELKPCPFCGGNAAIHYISYDYGHEYESNIIYPTEYAFVRCKQCRSRTEIKKAKYAVIAWNRRAYETD